ncbi:PWWP domain [Arabidopsis suecica]|uniref:PWWP domain n=1 Tax=Arabidopsis suecica TaxID=45249 RepID=A0A8T2F7E7_ARASU|nr:PWWP domain [Arabidopsis suecica]
MGSSDERNCKAIDASVGGLVWVRRRNGAWWPGRIMAHHEVPDGTIVSPKSGTPIKLLGRDDASVDWYNLEKSKRVKAFRCGEYDACIATAKATASTTGKKAVKYARREDAIAHALEIENAHLAKDHPPCIEKASTSGEVSRKGIEDSGDVAETEVALQSTMSLKKNKNGKASKVQPLSEKRRRTPNDSEDDGTQTNKRMRGLEDIGMGTGSKGKVQVGALLEDTQENGFKSDTNNINDSVSNGSLSNGSSRDCSPSMKRKRSPVVIANDYSKRKNRRRTLTKVLESTATVSIPGTCDKLVNSDCLSLPGVSESDNNSDSNEVFSENVSENIVEVINDKGKESEVSNISVLAKDDSSNGLFDVPLNGDEKYPSGISTVPFTSSSPRKALVSGPTRRFGQSSHDDVVKSEGSNGSPSTSPAATLFNGIKKSTSKWQLKGKRNSRQMSKKQVERRNAYAEEANNNALPHWSVSDQKPRSLFSVGTQAMGRNSELYDVKIEVKANYKPRNVPLISLRSKLNGEAIVGHPSVVEVLEDGSCGHIVSSHRIDDAKPKPSSKKKSKKKKPHFPPQASKSKKSSSLAIKTRCLSALSGQKLTLSSKKKVMIESTKERIVACIPLKVVFSRINEAVKGSARQVHRSLPSAGNTG